MNMIPGIRDVRTTYIHMQNESKPVVSRGGGVLRMLSGGGNVRITAVVASQQQ